MTSLHGTAAQIADEVAEAYLSGLGSLADHPAAWVRRGPGAAASVSGLPSENFNGVFVHGSGVDAAVVAGFLDDLAASGFPHGLKMRPAAGRAVESLAGLRGFAVADTLPLMSVEREAFRPAHPADFDLRLLGPTETPIQIPLVAEGLGAPEQDIAAFMSPRNQASEGWRIYLGEVGGALAATGTAIRCGDHVSLAAIATDPAHRRKGFAAALTSRMVADAFEAGARRVFLHSSQMGYRVYEALGFQLLEHWTIWTRRT